MIFRLTTTYRQRNDAKKYGARWNGSYWYYDGPTLPEGLRKYYPNWRDLETPAEDVLPEGFETTETENPFNEGIPFEEGLPFHEETSVNSEVPFEEEAPFEEEIPFDAGTTVDVSPVLEEDFPAEDDTLSDDEFADYMTVTQLSEIITDGIAANQAFHHVMVQGEVTNYAGVKRGHTYYFTLKDDNAQLNCIMWDGVFSRYVNFPFKKGGKVALVGNLDYHTPSGKFSFKVSQIYDAGEGPAYQAYLALKKKLSDEGIFSPEHKKPIPEHPKRIGIIMSKTGAVIDDICQYQEENNPYVELVLYNTNVQGKNAVATITKAIRYMDAQGFDVLIVGRGGGSDEDYSAYNDEKVVRAVFAAKTPVISAVGHQKHAPLLDLVADQRVSTPTKAAAVCIQNVMKDITKVNDHVRVMKNYMNNQLKRRWDKLEILQTQLGKNSPAMKLRAQQDRLRVLQTQLEKNNPAVKLRERQDRLRVLQAQLEKNSPAVKLRERQDRLEILKAQLEKNSPEIKIRERQERLMKIREFLQINMQKVFESRKHRAEMLIARLNGLSPTAKLVKGFGYIEANGKPLTSVENIKAGDGLDVIIHDGSVHATVDRVTLKTANQE